MEKFDIDKMERLKKRDKILTTWVIYLIYAIDMILLILLFVWDNPAMLLIIWLPTIFIDLIVRYVGDGCRKSKKYTDIIRYYVLVTPCSDETMRQIKNAAMTCSRPSDIFSLQCLLADQASDRGDIQYAEQIIYSADTSIFEKYPKLALQYYTTIIEMYYFTGDHESVKRAYADGEPYFKKYGSSNANMYLFVLHILTYYNIAYGNYGEAERLAEYGLNSIQSLDSIKKSSSAYQNYMYCFKLIITAECNLRNNNITAAADHCENALQLAPQGTFAAYKASKLMNEIQACKK